MEDTIDNSNAGVTVRQALAGIPRVSETQWQLSSWLVRWLIATRASVIVMTVYSVMIALLSGLIYGGFDLLIGVLCLTGLCLAHAANNLLNDIVDTSVGVDDGNYFRTQYGTHVLQDALLSQRQLWLMFCITGCSALLLGSAVIYLSSPWVMVPLVIGGALLLFYTWPLKKMGLGEVAVYLVWGPLIVMGTHYAMAGWWSWQVFAVACVAGLGPTTVIFGKHIDKLEFDQAKQVHTLPVRLGDELARKTCIAVLVMMYAATLLLMLFQWLPWTVVLVLLALPSAVGSCRVLAVSRPKARPDSFPAAAWPLWFAAYGFAHNVRFSVLLLSGLLLAALLR
jgi:1,4-dihydroxy-2-naphthoate polyprenyltransferase